MSGDILPPVPPGAPPRFGGSEDEYAPPECLPKLDELEIEDGKPVESIFAEKQYRLLTEPLYSSWPGPGPGRPFLALANVGLFYRERTPALGPDVMLSLDVQVGEDLSRRENRSYYLWRYGKPPEVVIEMVSDRRGGEAGHTRRDYARIGVAYYVIFDPDNRLGEGVLRCFVVTGREYQPLAGQWLPGVGLGLTLWEGDFEGHHRQWLRWCDQQGQVIPTGAERAARLEARLRELGIEP
jgi:Uma2 family endonuclease